MKYKLIRLFHDRNYTQPFIYLFIISPPQLKTKRKRWTDADKIITSIVKLIT